VNGAEGHLQTQLEAKGEQNQLQIGRVPNRVGKKMAIGASARLLISSRPFTHIQPPVCSYLAARLLIFVPLNALNSLLNFSLKLNLREIELLRCG
jgi:hypothetical protein